MTEIEAWIAAFASRAPRAGRLLDVGCGTKPYRRFFPDWEFVGIDVPETGRPNEHKTVDAWFDGLTIPYDEQSFDAVLCTEVLEHALEPDRIVAEIHRVLRPGCHLVVTVPFMWGEHETPFDFRRYSTEGVRRLLEGAGFVVQLIERSQPGVDAIAALVASEIRAYETSVPPRAGIETQLLNRVESYLWRGLLRVWRRRYRFDRIYIDNLVVAYRPA